MYQPPIDQSKARRAVRRGVVMARVSGGGLILLGGISTLVNVMNPLTASFLISVAIVINGICEWRFGGILERLVERAPGWLSFNQIALALEIVLYALWQANSLSTEAIQAVFASPTVASLLEAFSPGEVELLMETLPPLVRLLYVAVGAIAVVGCTSMAMYYRSRQKYVATLRAAAGQ